MTRVFDHKKLVEAFMDISFVEGPHGYVVWRVGTGGNTELLHLYAYPTRKGHGQRLLKQMLVELLRDPPFHTVYGFCLASNQEARKFYDGMGFVLSPVCGVYKEGGAYVFSQSYQTLKELHGVHERQSAAYV